MNLNKNNYPKEIISATSLLLSISGADNNIEASEVKVIKDIIIDFFQIPSENLDIIIEKSLNHLKESTDLYEFGKILNESFTYQDKIDFICCAFEVAYADKELHYLEEHFIKKISFILNVEHMDLIASKKEIENYLT